MDTGLFNLLTRQQVYIEGVKNWFSADLVRYLKLLRDAITGILNKLGVKSLGDLTPNGVKAVILKIDKRANEILSDFGTEFLAELRKFGRITATAQKSAYAVVRTALDVTGVKVNSIWSAVKDRIIPAYGKTAKDAASDLVASARDKIRSRLRMGEVDSEPLTDTVEAVTALGGGEPSTLKTIGAGARQYVATALQHAAGVVSDVVGAVVHDCYQWCSVIDSRTSPICKERNGQVYRYGDGPLPPAHPHCRSHTVPVECGDKGAVPTFYNWVMGQPSDFLKDAFGANFASKVADRAASVKDMPDVVAYPALSLDEYELKTPLLTA